MAQTDLSGDAAAQDHGTRQFVSFVVEGQRFALPLESVERVVRMVRVTPVPATPSYVEGMIDLQGQVLPVVNMRKRFGLTARAPGLDDRLVVARGSGRSLALMVDDVADLVEVPSKEIEPPPPAPRAKARPVTSVIRKNARLIMVVDPDKLIPSAKHVRASVQEKANE